MKMAGTMKENERSWAIDLISSINTHVRELDGESVIQHASGEMSLSTGLGALFPDILLFGDRNKLSILQGWELKYPDTDIKDRDFINNAIMKADLLGVNSFLLWNVSLARLYVKCEETQEYEMIKEWDSLSHITTRTEVAFHMHEVEELLYKIIDELNVFFRNGTLKSEKALNFISSEKMVSVMFKSVGGFAESIKRACIIDSDLNDEIALWWSVEQYAYGSNANKWFEISKLAILSLMNKFIFAHILKKYNKDASIINSIKEGSSISLCLDVFQEISKKCDFYNIFEEKIGEKYIDNDSLISLLSFNNYLINLDFTMYEDNLLEGLLSQVVTRSKRRVSGQFSTPRELALFLSALTMKDKSARVLDPCCGTGTIVKSVYDMKREVGISCEDSIRQIWAGDKFRYPLQFAMLALTVPENMGKQINIYKNDVFNLSQNEKLQIHDANSNIILDVECGTYDVIVSNLPFVQQETLEELNQSAISFIESTASIFDGRSDLYTYIALKLDDILSDNGRIGIIISNSWLGTEFGDKFFSELQKKYNLEYIVTSGKGRWFKNADVVTNILILEKKDSNHSKKDIKFVVLKEEIKDLIGSDQIPQQVDNAIKLAAQIRKDTGKDGIEINSYSLDEINQLNQMGIIRNSLFTDCKWLLEFEDKLVSLTKYFNVKRGERRGWNPLFYPQNHSIEDEYIIPVMKRLDTSSYIMNLDSSIDGFSCDKSIEDLTNLNHSGALDWINKFKNEKNGTGKLLVDVLARRNTYWYQMSLENTFDIGLLISPDERLFFSKSETPVFFDQRLTGLVRKDKNDNITLLAAMLNSILGIFYIEAIGFGRGLGVLDLNKNKVEERFKMLNPELLNNEDKIKIINLYKKLEKRDVKSLKKELDEQDRVEFDKAVLAAFGVGDYYEQIKTSLLNIFNIRKAVN